MEKATKYTIDAKDRALGRVAEESAIFLMGKNLTSYSKNKAPQCQVEIINASKLNISNKKLDDKEYKSYSGYPGGLKKEKMSHLLERKQISEVLRKAVFGMLPKNRLRAVMMKNLIVKE